MMLSVNDEYLYKIRIKVNKMFVEENDDDREPYEEYGFGD